MNIFIFHRDFRIEDNNGLIALIKKTQKIMLLFIITEVQNKINNPYFSDRAFKALIYCLKKLNEKKVINVIEAKDEVSAIENLIKQGYKIERIYTNKDLTTFALKRSLAMFDLAKKENFNYHEVDDYLLRPYDEIKTNDDNFYQVFTPYYNKVVQTQKPIKINRTPKFESLKLPDKLTINLNKYESLNFNLPLTREAVFKQIQKIAVDYGIKRNILASNNGSSKLSAAIKFGVVSIREIHFWVWKKFGKFDNPFTRQLIWRDFFYQTTFNAILQKKWKFGNNWQQKIEKFPWVKNQENFEKWKIGQTGFLLVDAAMHELNNFGTMHNRARLVAASFLVKNLLINWKVGEKYFAEKLIDYDPVVNQCSWQWVAGTGFDAQPFIRIFNPEIQQKKFDVDKKYINQFLPKSLQNLTPIVDYKKTAKQAIELYIKLKNN